MTSHPLDPLLKPGSIALLGASDRVGSPGNILADMVINSAYCGRVYPINPRIDSLFGVRCFQSLKQLPETVDHVVISLGNPHLEQALCEVINHGAKAATIYSSGVLTDDGQPNLQSRLTAMAEEADIVICGGNGMGFYSVTHGLFAGIFNKPKSITKGNISYIAQSGSAFTTLCHNGNRLGFNLCVSSGNEMCTSISDYMDWSLEQPDTQVIGLFLETVRNPKAFVLALQKANAKRIPVVILKIGRSPLAVAMALTHTGAIAGNHAAFEALFKKYGVIEVQDINEMAATLMLLQTAPVVSEGSLAAAFESGGFRELFADLAQELGVEFASISTKTKDAVSTYLDPGLKPENPLDVWGTHECFEERFLGCLRALMQDTNVAGGAFVSNYRDNYFLSEAMFRVVETVSNEVNKPIVIANMYSDLNNPELARRAYKAGIPMIDGARETLLAFRHLFNYQQFTTSEKSEHMPEPPDGGLLSRTRQYIVDCEAFSIGESEALAILADFSIPVVKHAKAMDLASVKQIAEQIGYPLVMKTAENEINHKSDVGGVIVGIKNHADLIAHYQDLSNRLGPNVLLSQMAGSGVEIALGTFNDPLFGPMMMVAAGGILVEMLSDKAISMCPVSHAEAERMLNSLKITALLKGTRGQRETDTSELINAIVKLSEFADQFQEVVSEIDVNPMIINQEGAVAVDGLIIKHPSSN